ncbi:MAG TPA: tyrosine-type recombinase/integrase, partial [Candidatus Methylacidiphilales bacterium]
MRPKYQLYRVGENLYRNGHGQYFAWIFRGRKQIKQKLKTTDLIIAKNRLAELFAKVDGLADDRSVRFELLAEKWLESLRVKVKTSTWERSQCSVKALLPFFKGELVRSLTLGRLEEWAIRRAKELGPSTYNKELETLKRILRYAEDHGIILQNPAQKLKRRKLKKVKHTIPTMEQFRALVADLKSQTRTIKAGAFVEFLAHSGVRLDEGRHVRRQHVNWKRNVVRITGGIEGTKGGEEREIPIFPSLKTFLVSYLDGMEDKSAEALLFPSRGPRKLADGRQAKKPPLFSAKHAIETACDRLHFPRYT